MNQSQAQRVITLSMLLAAFVGTAGNLKENKGWPAPKFYMSVFITWLVASFLADIEPQIGTPIGGAVLATMILGDNGLVSLTGKKGSAPDPSQQKPQTQSQLQKSLTETLNLNQFQSVGLSQHPPTSPVVVSPRM